jgi:hypothetical protein
MAAPSLNAAGLAAAPQAMESLAAQDAMGTTPPEMMMPAQGMAAGGVVSFQTGGYNEFSMGDGVYAEAPDVSDEEKLDYLRSKGALGLAQVEDLNRGKVSLDALYRGAYTPPSATRPAAPVTARPAAINAPAAAPAAPATPPPAVAGSSANPLVTYRDPYADRMAGILDRFDKRKPPSAQDLETAALTRQARYEEDVPFRLGYLEKEMAGRAKEMADRKQSNINEALIQAGLGIMGSKSPRFLQAVSEGGTAGLRAYQQGAKDIRAGEDLLRQSKIDYNKAQMLYDQGKFNEADKAKQQSVDEYKRGIDSLNTESALLSKASESSRAAFKLPYEIQYMQQAGAGRGRVDTTPSGSEIKVAQELGNKALLAEIQRPGSKIKLGTPEAEAFVNNYARDILLQSGKIYTPPSIAPTQTVRGSPESAAR